MFPQLQDTEFHRKWKVSVVCTVKDQLIGHNWSHRGDDTLTFDSLLSFYLVPSESLISIFIPPIRAARATLHCAGCDAHTHSKLCSRLNLLK